jgi:hypothetical protein
MGVPLSSSLTEQLIQLYTGQRWRMGVLMVFIFFNLKV